MNSKHLSKASFLLPTLLLVVAQPSLAGTIVGGVEVLDPDELVAGKTQALWSNLWWQYIVSIPTPQNPSAFDDFSDPLGKTGSNEKAQINQSDSPVFFITGAVFDLLVDPSRGDEPIKRTINVRSNQFVFFPLNNQAAENSAPTNDPNDANFFGNLPVESDNFNPPEFDFEQDCINNPNNPNPFASLRDCTAGIINTTTDLFITINGVEIKSSRSGVNIGAIDLFQHRQKSPQPFSYELPVDNVIDVVNPFFLNNPDAFTESALPASISPVISDGYWLMLAPLSPGEYSLNFGGEDLFTSQDITYNITSIPVPESSSVLGLLALGALGVGSALKGRLRSK